MSSPSVNPSESASLQLAPTVSSHPVIGLRGEATWPRWANLVLGAWLISSPATLGYGQPALAASDLACGGLIMALSLLWRPGRSAAVRWISAGIGGWLLMAPLVFWAQTAGAFANDTLVGLLVITFSILVPQPTRSPGSGIPPGWTYNPASWGNRLPIIIVAVFGFLVARYMAAFQLGHIPSVWDPFFGRDTERILKSTVAEWFLISDAGLGAVAYLVEGLSGILGDTRRWRTMPWMVASFFLLVVPSGVTSVVLVILQPVAVGAWCTLCLVTAAVTLAAVPPALDELVATGQFLLRIKREGGSMWSVFWRGDHRESAEARETPAGASEDGRFGLFSAPALWASLGVGIWMIASPAVLGLSKPAADPMHLTGALVVTFSVVAMAEVGRALRFMNLLLALWIAVAPWFLTTEPAARWNGLLCGLALVPLTLPRGKVEERHGRWDRLIV